MWLGFDKRKHRRTAEASHGITAQPSYLISKVAHILEWFERYQ